MSLKAWRGLALAAVIAMSAAASASAQQGVPMPPAIAAPQDVAYPGGVIQLQVDASDVQRGIFRVRETVPVTGPGPITLLYPEWLPGNHAPRGPINFVGGLEVRANGQVIPWRRDPVNVFAFHVDAPAGATALEITFQYLSPTTTAQGRVSVTRELMDMTWNTVILYPAGYYASRIRVAPQVTLPENWQFATALDGAQTSGQTTRFAETDLETLVDSPLYAGRHFRRIDLDPGEPARVYLNIVADRADQIEANEEQIRLHRNLVRQAYRLFGTRPYDHYDLLLLLSDRAGGRGIEHHRSSENGLPAAFFTDWEHSVSSRQTMPHEITHAWNGKYRRPADLWTPSYDVPMRGSLLWVYEGMTQYYGSMVLTARSGLHTRQQALDALALAAATYQNRAGRQWRSVEDTTNDPIASARRPAPWLSWQRSEDYYVEGQLIWLEADTLIRERSGGRRSLDDFARIFFASRNGDWRVNTYTFEDVVATLNRVQPYDWATFLRERIYNANAEPPLDGLARGGWRLVYTEERSAYQRNAESWNKSADFMYSIGLTFSEGGAVTQVMWDGPAFNQGITVNTTVLAVNGVSYSAEALRRAITAAKDESVNIELMLKEGDQYRVVTLNYHGGLRYPHLERTRGPDRVGAILSPR